MECWIIGMLGDRDVGIMEGWNVGMMDDGIRSQFRWPMKT